MAEDLKKLVKFTPCECLYDKTADLREVDQFGAIDLRAAFISRSIPENVQLTAESFNEVEDAQSLLGRPSDVFDAIRKAEYVRAASAGVAAEAAETTSSGNE